MSLTSGRLEPNGTVTAGSMAAEIELALETPVPLGANEDPTGRRKVAVAIAHGVLKHLMDHPDAIHVTVPNTGGGGTHEQGSTIDVVLGP
ncbi:MAG: hypothetical protein ACXV8R_09700 [Acidimicrobiia bacterium]